LFAILLPFSFLSAVVVGGLFEKKKSRERKNRAMGGYSDLV